MHFPNCRKGFKMTSRIHIEEAHRLGEVTCVTSGVVEFKLQNKKAQCYSTKYGANLNPLNIGQYVVVENIKSITLAQITFVGSNILTHIDNPSGTTVKAQILGSYSLTAKRSER